MMSQHTGSAKKQADHAAGGINRREVLKYLLGAGALMGSPFLASSVRAFSGMTAGQSPAGGAEFVFAQLAYGGGNWDAGPSAWENLRRSLQSATSIEARPERQVVGIDDDRLFTLPFLFVSGENNFLPFKDDEIRRLRKYFNSGGTLLADDAAAAPRIGFDSSFRREVARIFPDDPLERLAADHTVYKSFYLIRGMGGRRIVSPFLEGITRRGRTVVIYSPNGISAAWAKDTYGRWLHDMVPGGERQRKVAFQLGVNIIMYALCADYKQDRIHIPFLRRKS